VPVLRLRQAFWLLAVVGLFRAMIIVFGFIAAAVFIEFFWGCLHGFVFSAPLFF
jgi:hypothetical protein